MGKDPAMLWYPNDWTGGTGTFSRHLKGCYMDLLMAQFNNGHLSLDEIKTVLGADFGSWPALQKKFTTDSNGLFFNKRLEIEKDKRIAFTESRKNNLKSHTEPHMNTHMAPHMENRNRDLNKDQFIMVSGKKISDPLPMLEYFEAALNGRQKENGGLSWRALVPKWFEQNLEIEFNDNKHVLNSFSRYYLGYKTAASKPSKSEEIKNKLRHA